MSRCTLTRASRRLQKIRNRRAACPLPQRSGRGILEAVRDSSTSFALLTSLLRNCCHRCMVEHFSSCQIDEAQAEFFGATAETVNEPCVVVLEVGGGAGVAIDEVAAHHPINQHGEFAGGGGDSLGPAQAVSHAPI